MSSPKAKKKLDLVLGPSPDQGSGGKALETQGCGEGEGSMKEKSFEKGVDLGTGLRGQTPGFLSQAIVSVPLSEMAAFYGTRGPPNQSCPS